MAYEIKISDLKRILRRRKNILIVSFGLVFCTFMVVAFALPPIYRAQVTIIIENQEIPEEYVRSMTTEFIGERLNILEREILSYNRLLEIIHANNLYPELASDSQMVAQLREDFSISTENISISDRRSGGRGGAATIAFTLAYEHKNPHKAALVANTLSNLYVEKDRQSRESRATTTTDFLERELDSLRRQVREYEEQISRFRATNIDQLPGSTGIFQQMVFRLDQDLINTDQRIRNLQEKLVYLNSQIANIDPMVPILTEGGKVAANPANRLKFLRLQLVQMQANLSDRHPDIIRLRSEIAKLEAQVGASDTTQEKISRLTMLEKEIAEAKSKYGDRHPDVVRLSREADLLNRQLSQPETAGSLTSTTEEQRSDNPGYMNIRAQIIVAESEFNALREQRERISRQLADYQRRLEMAPFIDEQYNSLTLDHGNAKAKFNEVSNKLHAARIAQEMSLSEYGERFRINHPAPTPDSPYKPNRVLIILMGFVVGIGCSILLAALVEGLDSSIKVTDELESVLGTPILATISYYDSPAHKRQRWIRRLVMTSSIIVFTIVGSIIVDRYVMPLSDVWDTVEDRLVEMGFPIEKEAAKS